jgi:precorrin-6B methylase 2
MRETTTVVETQGVGRLGVCVDQWLGRARVRRLLARTYHRAWDWKLGVRTGGDFPTDTPSRFNDNGDCSPTSYRVLKGVFSRLEITSRDVLADYGCGKGRTICFAGQYPFKKIYGVEISPKWAQIARENVSHMRGARAQEIQVVTSNALDFDCADCTIIFLANPFGIRTFEAVLGKIRESLRRNPRPLRLVYYNPTQRALFDAADWLTAPTILYDDGRGLRVLMYENVCS